MNDPKDGHEVLEVDPNVVQSGQSSYLRSIRVTVNGSENLLMPMRVS